MIEEGDSVGQLVPDFSDLRPGDIIGWNFDARSNQLPNIEHVSAAVARPSGSSIEHIGGNTSASTGSGSQDNGGMVARKSYPASFFVAAWRPDFADASKSNSHRHGTWRKELKPGDKGSDVRLLQKELNEIDNAHLDVDGEFGPLTEKAVKKFQTEKGWNVDGTVDLKLIKHLEERITKHK